MNPSFARDLTGVRNGLRGGFHEPADGSWRLARTGILRPGRPVIIFETARAVSDRKSGMANGMPSARALFQARTPTLLIATPR